MNGLGYSELDLCPMCLNVALVVRQDEEERTYCYCRNCGYDSKADDDGSKAMAEQDRQDCANEAESGVELERDTPLGEELDGGNDAIADAMAAHYDDDPNPYSGTYSEE